MEDEGKNFNMASSDWDGLPGELVEQLKNNHMEKMAILSKPINASKSREQDVCQALEDLKYVTILFNQDYSLMLT